jgi:pilus assembly protein Flp/PilA
MRAFRLAASLVRCPRAATAVEYGFLLSLVVIVLVVGLSALGGATHDKWGNIAAKVEAVEP